MLKVFSLSFYTFFRLLPDLILSLSPHLIHPPPLQDFLLEMVPSLRWLLLWVACGCLWAQEFEDEDKVLPPKKKSKPTSFNPGALNGRSG